MGREIFGQIQVVEKISDNKLKLIPDVYIGGSAGSPGGEQGGLMSLALLQYLTGRAVLPAGAPGVSEKPEHGG